MRIPHLVLGAAILVWGWQNALLAYAVGLALIVELAPLVPWRWDFSATEFNRIADLSAVGLVLVVAWQFDAHALRGIYAVLVWLPVVLYGLLAAQLYSTRDQVSYAALFWSVRRARARGRMGEAGAVDFRIPYLIICLISATAGNREAAWLYAALGLILAAVLAANRPRRYRLSSWCGVLALALALGYVLQIGLIEARRIIEPLAMAWLRERLWDMRDPYRAYTANGDIGELKLSDRIVLRVHVPAGQPVPTLLREASYQVFSANTWLAGKTAFAAVALGTVDGEWTLQAGRDAAANSVWVSRTLHRGRGLLALPGGARRVDELRVAGLARNTLGTLKIIEGPALVRYRVRYTPGTSLEAPPENRVDLGIPRRDRKLFDSLARRLGLNGVAPSSALEKVIAYFGRGFRYSLILRKPRGGSSAIADFLTRTRSGHCEYYATATVLLLRAAGIPARYVTGYAINEYSRWEGAWVARRRHAHSWALAYVGGAWRDVDTTPAIWAAREADGAPWWEPISDTLSWLVYRYQRWRWGANDEGSSNWYWWLALGLGVYLAWRLYFSERVARRRGRHDAQGARTDFPGADSPFYLIEQRLELLGHRRSPGESLGRWFDRLGAQHAVADIADLSGELLLSHYRYRFDPRGLGRAGRRRLRAGVENWLRRHPASGVARNNWPP